jgi:Uma2 family endonuclease
VISTVASPRSQLRRFTRTEYDRLIALGFFRRERIELIHGTIVKMSPIGPPHRVVVDRLTRHLVPRLIDRALVSIQQPFAAWDESEPEPDVSVVPLGDYSVDHPGQALLIIEVADSSLDEDRETKAPLYAASGVPEYWIVNLVEKVVEIYTDPADGRYRNSRRARSRETVAPGAFPDVVMSVADLLP